MNMKTVVPLGLAIVLGLVAAILVRNTIAHHGPVANSNGNTVAVVVAKQDIEPGKELTALDVTVARVPAEIAPSHVFSDPTQLVGRVPTAPLVKGQTIMETLLATTGSGSGLQALIPPGMRAVTLEINEFSGVGGMLEPGCHVDLVSTIVDPKSKEAMARTILQNVKISAIGRNTSPAHPAEGQPLPPPSNNVTLLLTPKQVQTLQLAQMATRPWLVLRSNRDGQEVALDSTPLAMLRGEPIGEDANNNDQVQSTISIPTTPVAVTPAIDTTPTTPTTEEQPTTYKRTMTIIRGGVETHTSFTIPIPHGDTANTVDQLKPVDSN